MSGTPVNRRQTTGLRPAGRVRSLPLWCCCVLSAAWSLAAAESPAQKPVFHPTIRAACDAAAADQNLVLLIFGADWCPPCKLLRKNTLESAEFLEQGGGLHVAEVDVESNPKAARDFAAEILPTLVLMTADGKIIERLTEYVDTVELLPWLQEGRRRAKAGQWEGTVPSVKLDEFSRKSAAEGLSTSDLQRLIAMLGEADPIDRAAAGKILLAQREQAVPLLIASVGDAYLGTRIAATELLPLLAPGAASLDPWQSPDELSGTVAALSKWWTETGAGLSFAPAPRVADSAAGNSIRKALELLRGDDPARRTEAMTALAEQGAVALPDIRDAIKRSERSGDQRSLSLLEDVRWAILVPDSLEQRAGVRSALARGKSQERQAAATRLGNIGRDALDALAELANDADPLVVESAVRALSDIGGNDAIPAMAALLRAADSNLRMTAAQALGHTKNADAIKPLLTIFDDPNEIVACTAVAALEEIRSQNTPRGELSSPESAALKGCLNDSRWRVRAAAVEVIGKLSLHDLAGDLKKLLDDPDGFVVKNTLAALGQLNAAPTADQLAALGKRLPSLRGDTVEMLLQSESDETVRIVTGIFDSSRPEEQVAILNAMARQATDTEEQAGQGWKPLLTRAATASNPKLRRAAAETIGAGSPKLAAELVGPLLADDDLDTRAAAAGVIINILARASGKSPSSRFSTRMIVDSFSGAGAPKTPQTNSSLATPEQIAGWHSALLQHPAPTPDLRMAAAQFATGDRTNDLPALAAALERAGSRDLKWLEESSALELILAQLPWPQGRSLLDKVCGSPRLFAVAARDSGHAASPVSDFLFEPSRFRAALERASGDELNSTLQLLAGYNYQEQSWSLWTQIDRTKAIALALVDSTNSAWRAAAVFSLGLRGDAEQSLAIFEKAVADSNVWVRGAAARALARSTKDRSALEQRMAPLLTDPDLSVATVAAVALLEPEIAEAAQARSALSYFQFEGIYGGRSESFSASEERPLTTLEGKPAFLQSARAWLAKTNAAECAAFALLLAQYGEFDGLDRLIAETPESSRRDDNRGESDVILAGVGLSRDAKYIPALRRMMQSARDEWNLRKFLRALKGMTGPDARQLRLEINKRIRDAAGSPVIRE